MITTRMPTRQRDVDVLATNPSPARANPRSASTTSAPRHNPSAKQASTQVPNC
jgi:hypothetical protein